QCRQAHQPAAAGHVQVEQDQVDIAWVAQAGDGFVQRAGFQDNRVPDLLAHGLCEGAPEQWMVVGDQDGGHACRIAARWCNGRPDPSRYPCRMSLETRPCFELPPALQRLPLPVALPRLRATWP